MNAKSGLVMTAILVGIAVASIGMAIVTGRHNALVASGKANTVYLGANVGQVFRGGFVEAVQNRPGESTLAATAGILAGAAVEAFGKSKGSDEPHDTISVTGDRNTVIYQYGQGNSQKNDQSTRSGQ